MKVRSRLMYLVALSAALVPFVALGVASADEPPSAPAAVRAPEPVRVPAAPDGARLRIGGAIEGGARLMPGVVNNGVAGIQGQVGVQINNLIGLYAAPSMDLVFRRLGGLSLGMAILVDFIFKDRLTVGIGPDASAFVTSDDRFFGVGGLVGGRLHFAWYPVERTDSDEGDRKALAVGVDVRLLSGGGDELVSSLGLVGRSFVLLPTATIGYQAF